MPPKKSKKEREHDDVDHDDGAQASTLPPSVTQARTRVVLKADHVQHVC